MRSKVIGIFLGAALLTFIVCLSECVHTQIHELESKVEAKYCTDVRATIVEYLHARRGLSCGTTGDVHDILNARNNIAEIHMLMDIHRDSGCNTEQLFIDILTHVGQCTQCQEYIKCGD